MIAINTININDNSKSPHNTNGNKLSFFSCNNTTDRANTNIQLIGIDKKLDYMSRAAAAADDASTVLARFVVSFETLDE